jgi:hypothetical protein
VLDALGLPRGAINPTQSVDLTQQTTLRPGDSFQIEIEGVAARTATITIAQGETYNSLVTKINAQLGQTGTAAVNYTGTNQDMTITAKAGNTINLVAGPADFNALARLGISPGVISAPAKGSSSATTATSTSSTVKPTYGLGLTATALGPLDISTKTGADLARSQLLVVQASIQSTYQKSNTPPASTSTNPGNTSGTASATTTAQLANYSLALSLLGNTASSATNNIATIVGGGSLGGAASTSSADSILGLFG